MAILETTLGHDRNISALKSAVAEKRLPFQWLFVGPEGIGKKRCAWGMVELLLCERPLNSMAACGVCDSCLKVVQGFHERVLKIEPEKNGIKLERVREIQDFLSLAQDQGARVILMDEAHALNAQASNALLKILEEPPPQTYFFLITHRWTQVLPTIRSRATRMVFCRLSDSVLAHWAPGDPELVRWARGSVRELLNQREGESLEMRQEALRHFENFFKDPDYFILGPWREAVKDKSKLILFIHIWLVILRDGLRGRLVGASEVEFLAQHSNQTLWDLWERGLTLEDGLLGNRDPVLLLEEWLTPALL